MKDSQTIPYIFLMTPVTEVCSSLKWELSQCSLSSIWSSYTLVMKGWWESNINVWPFMYSQQLKCAASLFHNRIIISHSYFLFLLYIFPEKELCGFSPIPTLIYLWEIYIFLGSVCMSILLQPKYVDWSWEYINRSQTPECRNWDRGRTIPFLGIYKLDFW